MSSLHSITVAQERQGFEQSFLTVSNFKALLADTHRWQLFETIDSRSHSQIKGLETASKR
jgi:hypothetical protein